MLAARIQTGDKAALNMLVEANLKFVVAVCKNYRNQGMPFGDLISEGNLGLIKAAKRFDGSAGCKFISYAVWWIRQGILVALADQSRFLNISVGRIGAIRRVGCATRRLEQELGRTPGVDELARRLDIPEKLVTECLEHTLQPKSLSHQSSGDGPSLEEIIEDRNGEGSDRRATVHMLRKNTSKVLDQIDVRKAEILRLSYGIGCETVHTLTEIAEKLDISRERVRQIKAAALGLLRHPVKRGQLGI